MVLATLEFQLSGAVLGLQQRVPVSLALSLCQSVLRPRRGLGQASPSLEAPRSQALEIRQLFHQQNRKGKIVMIKVSRYMELVLVWFWHLKLI